MSTEHPRGYRSIFWPVLLVGLGVIWLLANLEIIPGWSWWNLWRLWPLLLVVIGLDLLFARRSPLIGALLGLATVAAAVAVLLAAPSLGWTSNPEAISEMFNEPLGSARSAEVELEFSLGTSTVEALPDSTDLIRIEGTHLGEVAFTATGDTSKSIRLQEVGGPFSVNLGPFQMEKLRWDVGLTPKIPLKLRIDSGVGSARLDLADLQIASLDLTMDVGVVTLFLPATEATYEVALSGGVGKLEMHIEDGASVSLDIRGDVGDMLLDIPEDSEVHLEAETDVGNIRVPARFDLIRKDADRVVGVKGVWETPGFDDAEQVITIVFDGAVGNLTIR